MTSASWFVNFRPAPQSRLRLFCFHYAGGGTSFCRAWAQELAPAVEVIAGQLPGREQRFSEPPLTQMRPLILGFAQAMHALTASPYVLLGHSMGAVVAYELAREIARRGWRSPQLLIVGGREAPGWPRRADPIAHLPDESFCQSFLRRYPNAQLREVLGDADLRSVFLPQLRADMQLIEAYQSEESEPLQVPVVACAGLDETDLSETALGAWQTRTRGAFRSYRFPGGHFFINESQPLFLNMLRHELGALRMAS